MIKLKSHSKSNISIIDDKFQSMVRARFIEIYAEMTGGRISTDFRLTMTSTRGKIYLSIEVGKKKRYDKLTKSISESEFRNRISESEFFNKAKAGKDNSAFQKALDQLMGELPSLYDDAKEK